MSYTQILAPVPHPLRAQTVGPIQIFECGHHLDSALAMNPEWSGWAYRFLPSFGPAGFRCCDCGAVRMFPVNSGITGYARVDGNQLCCYDCCDKRQREDMRDRSKPFYAYLSSGREVTTWTGGKLGTVYSYSQSRSGWHGGTIARFHVRDVHGQWWQGRGAGKSMACTLRPMKTPRYAI